MNYFKTGQLPQGQTSCPSCFSRTWHQQQYEPRYLGRRAPELSAGCTHESRWKGKTHMQHCETTSVLQMCSRTAEPKEHHRSNDPVLHRVLPSTHQRSRAQTASLALFPLCKVRNWITSTVFVLGTLNIFLQLCEHFFFLIFSSVSHLGDLHSADYYRSVLMPLAVGFISVFTPNAWHKECVSAVLSTEIMMGKLSCYKAPSSNGRSN